MADASLLVEIAGEAVPADELDDLDVLVEEATAEADAATVTARLRPGDDGEWRSAIDRLAAPRTPLAIEVGLGGARYRFDGLSAEAAWSIDPERRSRLTVKALDRTLELDLEEKVVAWPGTSDSGVAQAIFSAHGLRAEVEDTPAGPDPDVHVLVQRGSDWAFLRSLAARWGYAVYLEADGEAVVGHFHPLDPLAEPQGELALGFGGDAGRVEVQAELVAGPARAGAAGPGALGHAAER